MLDAIRRAMASGRTVALVHKGKARILKPESLTATHVRGWCLHRLDHRQFRLCDIEALKVWKRMEQLGPDSLGEPLEIDMASMSLATRIGAQAVDLIELRNRIDAMGPRDAGKLYDRVMEFSRTADELVAFVKASLIEYCESGREPLVETAEGLKRLYAKPDKRVKCRDPRALFRALLETGGPEVVDQALASDPFKQGECRKLLGSEWTNHFEVIEKAKLAEGAAPKKSLSLARDAEEVADE